MQRLLAVSALTAAIALSGAGSAAASTLFGRNSTNLHLYVRGDGALVTFDASGVHKRVVVSGAINALIPTPGMEQVEFTLNYGPKRRTQTRFTAGNQCRRYDGPELAFFVTGCKAPDGSYWAIQKWRYWWPFFGYSPWLSYQSDVAFHISHWKGPIAELELFSDWIYTRQGANAPHNVFGRLTYGGVPVYGFRAGNGGRPLDGYGRVVYWESLDSLLGRGWWRLTGILTRNPSGTFCHAMVPLPTYSNYPDPHVVNAGYGKRYRVYVEGPGVTPLVLAEVNDPGDWNPADPAKVARYEQGTKLLDEWSVPAACRKGH
jgi:hypothetical protein